MSRVEDFFGTAVYLVTDASNFISGHVLLVDGGWSTARPVQCKSRDGAAPAAGRAGFWPG